MTDYRIHHTITGESVLIPTIRGAGRVVTKDEPHGVMHVQEEFLRRIVREVLEERDAQVHPEMMRP